jgi:hypothetical protein
MDGSAVGGVCHSVETPNPRRVGFYPNVEGFEWIHDNFVNTDQIVEQQIKLGYHPAGYGGPYDIKQEQRGDKVIITWKCSDNCD